MDKDTKYLIIIFVPVIFLIIVGLLTKSSGLLVFTFLYMAAISLFLLFVFAIKSIIDKESVAESSSGVVKVKGALGRLYGFFYLFIAITIVAIILSMATDIPFIDNVADFFVSIFQKSGLIN